MNDGPGLALLAPGGLFEVVFLPVWLIARGFRSPSPDPAAGDRAELPAHREQVADLV
jgi:hypothetical protein